MVSILCRVYVWPMASSDDPNGTSKNKDNETDGEVLTVYFSSSCASKHPGKSCREAGCRHYRKSSKKEQRENSSTNSPELPHWASTSRTDNSTPRHFPRDELYRTRIDLLLNYDDFANRQLVGLMGNRQHKDAGVQVCVFFTILITSPPLPLL